ncbi:DUF3021 domain-containing protein [Staphylococcus saprophyticus]|uniref:DUF3021 domain-containing protein n=1 Tax=Staphylococcus equorum TaxID=246432 RepID=A0AAP7IBV3_9STAP|nr:MULTISPECIES: DUF3021 domain-containing protein [Staphylococcus]MDK9847741.1 DUF3021 domain-containing protein [Staphylococcus equorum]MDK9864325.1 DUF3021 domain-containing protein [Staphylococcus equorum]MDN5603462.1 DUF3021 domain-containing protein [Staphylococcus equorum]MDN6612617.1 DUF3021 domain-containing protein [Staphylococcus equorum]OEK51935.1 hypothetical protein ASS95_11350 [Staphylococcus equorum]
MKRLIIGCMTGISIGVIFSIIFSLVFANTKYQPVSPNSTMGQIYSNNLSEIQIMIVAVVIWSLIGIMFSFGSLIFTHLKFSIIKLTLMHFSLMLIIMFPLAILAGWFPLNLSSVSTFIIIFIIIYFIIWLIIKKSNQQDIYEINSLISKKKTS